MSAPRNDRDTTQISAAKTFTCWPAFSETLNGSLRWQRLTVSVDTLRLNRRNTRVEQPFQIRHTAPRDLRRHEYTVIVVHDSRRDLVEVTSESVEFV